MPRKKVVKIVEEEEEEQLPKLDISLLKDDNISVLDTYLIGVKIYLEKANLEELNNYQTMVNKINDNLTKSIQNLMGLSDKIFELNNLIAKTIIINQKKLTNNKIFDDLEKLIDNMENQDQIKRLEKILPDNQDYAKVYLQGYTVNEDVKKPNLLGTIKILGQYNFKKQERESYEIKVMQNESSTFWCSCIDHKLNSAKKNTVCKHIAFIVCKVIKVLELYFFDSKKLSPEHLQLLLAKISNKSEMWKNKDLVRNIKQLTINTFKDFPVPIEDVCTFCYDEMTNVDIPISVCCPACKHCYHSECMDIWLENYLRCSVCSSEIWKHYPNIKAGIVVDVNNKL
jgi:hypothetical protein